MHLAGGALPRADLMRRADEVMPRCMCPDVMLWTGARPAKGRRWKSVTVKE